MRPSHGTNATSTISRLIFVTSVFPSIMCPLPQRRLPLACFSFTGCCSYADAGGTHIGLPWLREDQAGSCRRTARWFYVFTFCGLLLTTGVARRLMSNGLILFFNMGGTLVGTSRLIFSSETVSLHHGMGGGVASTE